MGLFNDRITTNNKTQVPVWFMRQAGRYHAHYQNIKKDSDFMTMCKDPKLACEVTMGPINEFDFDAAILFSDLLFPLEQLGMGLTYEPGPILKKSLNSISDIKDLKKLNDANSFYKFQSEACTLLKNALPAHKTLLGFVGAPFTLYSYAVEGAHSGALYSTKLGLYDGRYQAFCELLLPELLGEMRQQALGGADAMCLFDTAAGELNFSDFKEFLLPVLREVTKQFKKEFPHKKVIYYSKFTHLNYLQEIQDENIDVLGIDWRMDLSQALKALGNEYYIQGNLEPVYLGLPWEKLEKKWAELFNNLEKNNVNFDKWIAGLGHGCLQWIPQENVKKSVEFIHKNFLY